MLTTRLKNKTPHLIGFRVPYGLHPISGLLANKKTLVKLCRILDYNGWSQGNDNWTIEVLIDGYPVKGLEITSSDLLDHTRIVFENDPDDPELLYIYGTPENDSDTLLRLKLCPASVNNYFWNKRPNNRIASGRKTRSSNGDILPERAHSKIRERNQEVLEKRGDLQMKDPNCQPNGPTAVRLDEPVRRTNEASIQFTGVERTQANRSRSPPSSCNSRLDSRNQWPRGHPPGLAPINSGSRNERAHLQTGAHNNDIFLELADLQMRALNSQPNAAGCDQLLNTRKNQLDSFEWGALFVIAFIIALHFFPCLVKF